MCLFQSNNILSRLSSLTPFEMRTLLTKYFEKVIDLREGEKKKEFECSSLEVKNVARTEHLSEE